MTEPRIHFNGVRGSNGQYAHRPLSPSELVALFSDVDEPVQKMVRWGVVEDDLASAGWGVIFAPSTPDEVKKALAPLLRLRRDQAGSLYREFEFLPGQDGYSFLQEHGEGPSLIDPRRVPFYLLLVGDPSEIPFDFQFALDVQHAVGRLGFDSRMAPASQAASYANYATTAAEWEEKSRPRRAALFGVKNEDDIHTDISLEHLVGQLKQDLLDGIKSDPELSQCQLETLEGDQATKQALSALFKDAPSLLFTAGHALLYAKEDPDLFDNQGALICSDWPGPKQWRDRLPSEHFFAAKDLADDFSLAGMIAFLFGCFTAGTPEFDSFSRDGATRARLCEAPFLSRLPQRLLSHGSGGALAVIGHVDTAWAHSFKWQEIGRQTQAFEMALKGLLAGQRVGATMQAFDHFHLVVAERLLKARLKANSPASLSDIQSALLWTAYHDARGYVVLGDPAVRLHR